MAVSRCAVRVGASFEGTTPSVSEMATSAGGVSGTFRKVAPAQREVVFKFTPPPLRQTSRSPEVVAADAIAEVKRLENAIQVLGETNPHAQPLVEALRVARAKTTVPPLQERIQSCKTFLERARQRVARAESVIARAVEQKEIYVKEVSEGESRLQTLMSEEISDPAHVSVPPDVQELQRQIDELRRERDLWRATQTQIPREPQGMWCADGPPPVREIPPIPTDHQELQGWVSERNCDLRNALEFSDSATVAKMGSQHSSRWGRPTWSWTGRPDQR